jgi:hypothetical protein
MKLHQKYLLDNLERMNRSRLPKLSLQYEPRGRWMWEDQDEDGETKNTLSFKGAGLNA